MALQETAIATQTAAPSRVSRKDLYSPVSFFLDLANLPSLPRLVPSQRLDGVSPENCKLLRQYFLQVDLQMSLSQLDQVPYLGLSHLKLILELPVHRPVQLGLELFHQSAGRGLVRLQQLGNSLEVDAFQVVQV